MVNTRKLLDVINEALEFNGMNIKDINNIRTNCGCIWFDYDGHTFYMLIEECEPPLRN